VVPMLNDINDSKVIVGHLLMDLGQTRQYDETSKEVTIGTYARNETFGDLKLHSFSEKDDHNENCDKETSKVIKESPSIASDQ
jgi:hypothetical protein